jgi:DNA-binding beta-propeller fold protein YncE
MKTLWPRDTAIVRGVPGRVGPVIVTLVIALAMLLARSLQAQYAAGPVKNYFVKLVCESSDRIVTLQFGPKGASLVKTAETRLLESDISGPHGLVFSPDKKSFFVSIGHGRPYGSAVKYSADDDRALNQVQLGMFPATGDVSPDGNFLYVVNFNLHGDPVPSSVSVVDTNVMIEVARIPTCVMPHGSRVTRDGKRQYSGCMMDDLLVEVDAEKMKVARAFRLSKGHEEGFTGLPSAEENVAGAHAVNHESMAAMNHATCQPTWAQPSVDGRIVYVACNKSSEIVEVDAGAWKVLRRIPAGDGVYNLAVTPDGKKLIATNKRGASISIFDRQSGTESAKLATKRKVVHGVTISPDSRYAFVTVEGVGSEPGTVEIIDLTTQKTVATVDTPPQAAGIDFWKME